MPTPRDDYLTPYREAVASLGPSFEALLWRNADMQRTRFDVLADLLDLTTEPAGRVVVDLGAGLADLALRLKERGLRPAGYLGVEALPELRAQAAARLAEAGLPAWCACEMLDADFAADAALFDRLVAERSASAFVFSGSLNTFRQRDAERVLDRAWDAALRVPGYAGRLAFNFLSDRAPRAARRKSLGPASRFDTLRMVAWALDRTPLVTLRTDYLNGHDATIAMRPATPRERG